MRRALYPAIPVVFTAFIMPGCAVNTANVTSPMAGLDCVDDSPECVQKRKTTLGYMMNDTSRAWVRQAPSAHAYASGVRLFAFRKKKSDLTCDELKIGSSEASNAGTILRGPQGNSLSPAQISRGLILAVEVDRDLRRELKRRCKASA